MKKKWFSVGFATMCCSLLMTGCSSDNEILNEDDNGLKEYGLKVQLVLPSTATSRTETAGTENFNDGLADEWKVTNAFFQFLDDKMDRISLEEQSVTFTGAGTTSDNITSTSATVTLLATRKPSYVLVHLNADNTIQSKITTMSYTNMQKPTTPSGGSLKADINEHYANTTTGFLMNNSTYVSGSEVVKAIPLGTGENSYIYDVDNPPATSKVLPIHVERVVAKTTVNVGTPTNAIAGKELTYKITETYGSITQEFGVKFLGWKLNATNKSYIPLKGLSNSYTFGSGVTWNSSGNYRSYWAEDGNYEDNASFRYLSNDEFQGTTLSYGNEMEFNYHSTNDITSLGSVKFDGSEPEYCFENTFVGTVNSDPGAVTHVLIKAQYTDKDGNAVSEDVFHYGKLTHTATALKQYAAEQLSSLLVSTGSSETVTVNEIAISRTATNFYNRTDVKSIVTYTGANTFLLDKQTTDWGGSCNKHLFGDATVWYYPNGICYYSIPIKHFGNLTNSDTGYYGVVRNHWYDITVTDVLGFGHPADPNKKIVPETIKLEEFQLQAQVNVLSWNKVSQDSSVGSGSWD